MGLGINKDLEPLVREVRRRGGEVRVTGATHVVWTLGPWTHRSGLTMSSRTAEQHRRAIRRHLDALDRPRPGYAVRPADDRWHLVDTATGLPVTNAAGYPRTFRSRDRAQQEARRLERASTSPG